MIKCPHCGSSAQVVYQGDEGHYQDNPVKYFDCDCGCEFEVTYEIKKVNIHTIKPKLKGHIHCPCNGTDCSYWKKGICSLYSEEEGWLDPIDECEDFAYFWTENDDYIDYGED